MKNLTWPNPEQLFVAQVLIKKVKLKCCGIKDYKKVLVDEDMDYYEREVIQDDLPSDLYQLDKDEITVKQIYQTDVF